MREWLAGIVGESLAPVVTVILAAALVILLALVLIGLARRVFAGTGGMGGRSRAPRLAVLDVTPVDPKRKLVLVRRDDVEHLILIGGQNDLVVEPGILRGQPRRQQPGGQRQEPGFGDADRMAQPAVPHRRVPQATPQSALAARPTSETQAVQPPAPPVPSTPVAPPAAASSATRSAAPRSNERTDQPTRQRPNEIAPVEAPRATPVPIAASAVPPVSPTVEPAIVAPPEPSRSSEPTPAPPPMERDVASRREPILDVPVVGPAVPIASPSPSRREPEVKVDQPAPPQPVSNRAPQPAGRTSAPDGEPSGAPSVAPASRSQEQPAVPPIQASTSSTPQSASPTPMRSMATPTLPPAQPRVHPSTSPAGGVPTPAVTPARSLWSAAPAVTVSPVPSSPPTGAEAVWAGAGEQKADIGPTGGKPVAEPVEPVVRRPMATPSIPPVPALSIERRPETSGGEPASSSQDSETRQPLSVRSFATTIQSRRPPLAAPAIPTTNAELEDTASSPSVLDQPTPSPEPSKPAAPTPSTDEKPVTGADEPGRADEKPDAEQRALTLEEEMERLLHDFTIDVSDRR